MFFRKMTLTKKRKKAAGMLATEVRTGDAPKPPFPMKTQKKKKKKQNGNQSQINHINVLLFLSLR